MRVPIVGEKISWLKGFFLFYLFFLVVFFAAAPFLTLWLYSETSVTRTLLPQLIGFCMQGGFLVVLFAFYEKRATVDTRRAWKYTLRRFMAPFVDACLPDASVSAGGRGELLPSPEMVRMGIETLRVQGLSQERSMELQRIARDTLVAMQALSVVAAQIDHAHLESWMSMSRLLRLVEQGADPEALMSASVAILEEVVQFDERFFM
ncbi:MAG: hypothetical protein HQL99_02435 [Magnetococcales bacterium]|nr:hypothetical protein [Magnetococcales bacterium]